MKLNLMHDNPTFSVSSPAQAGDPVLQRTQGLGFTIASVNGAYWMPACAGMTPENRAFVRI
jgi:hypothetical protein